MNDCKCSHPAAAILEPGVCPVVRMPGVPACIRRGDRTEGRGGVVDKTQSIELDRSSGEPIIKLGAAEASFTPYQLRSYAAYLTTVADEADKRPEPEVDELAAIIDATEARWVAWPESSRVAARAVLAAGYNGRSHRGKRGRRSGRP